MLQGGIVGFLIGILPGAGSTVASFVSYIIAKKTSKTPEEFGTGIDRGRGRPGGGEQLRDRRRDGAVADHGHPGSGTGAVLLGALVLYGLNPGPLLFHEHADVVWPIIASMYLGNIALLVMNLPMVPFFAKLLNTPYKVLYPAILLISVVGVYSVNFSIFDVGLLVVFGLLGYCHAQARHPARAAGPGIRARADRGELHPAVAAAAPTTARSSTCSGRSQRSSSDSPSCCCSSLTFGRRHAQGA